MNKEQKKWLEDLKKFHYLKSDEEAVAHLIGSYRAWNEMLDPDAKCECGCGNPVMNTLRGDGKAYLVCANCLVRLVNCSLKPEQFKSLIAKGHLDTQFLLHGDFYDEEGKALQPRR